MKTKNKVIIDEKYHRGNRKIRSGFRNLLKYCASLGISQETLVSVTEMAPCVVTRGLAGRV